MRTLIAALSIASLSGCASFTARPPVTKDRVGSSFGFGGQVGTLATAPDYRVVYVKLDENAKLCAEAAADAGAQFAQTFAGALSAPTGSAQPLSAETKVGLAVAMKQLFKRSQGIQLFRDGSFALCNLYLNGAVDKQQYFEEFQRLRRDAVDLIAKEIPFLEKITVDPIQVPAAPTAPEIEKNVTSEGADPK